MPLQELLAQARALKTVYMCRSSAIPHRRARCPKPKS